MIEDPFGLEWKSYSDQLINPQDQASILEAFKRNASFTLQKKEYEDVLSRIKAGNAVLQDLSRVHLELEPDRRSRSQLCVTKLVRRLSQSMYYALCRALTCACVYSHDIGIQLSRRYPIMLPNDVEDKVARELDFRITLKTSTADENGTIQTLQYTNTTQPMSHWNDFQLRLMNGDQLILNPLTSSPQSPLPTQKPRIRWALPIKLGVSRGTHSASSMKNPSTQTPVLHETTPGGVGIPPTRVLDLCGILRRSTKAPAVNCYGYVDHIPHKFMVSPPNDGTGPYRHITLRQVIDRSILNLPPFGFEERLQVALALSVSFLHLDGTPWFAQIITLDDIVFMVEGENATNQRSSLLYRPFIIKRVPKTQATVSSTVPSQTTPPTQTLGIVRPINPELLSLGALLTQIIIERVDNELEMTRPMDIKAIISVRRRGCQLEEETLVNGGMNYAAAVKWCFDNIHSVAGLQNDKFCHGFYGAVIARLQDDINTITSDA
ncbi:hypothetical protein EKO27_g8037 [Xylaria grammica]|uniref:DUF7580 domain-containing protein n=1 Tax=Xylaria grammica TaxID=363999 RepID=A0A439CXY5_9PEZI|nr:hypothetical protein EKO27_g8037 [Xylaria grammica]